MIRSPKIRNAAKMQDCTLNIVGVCNYDPATTVFCHFPYESKGMRLKSDDISGGFGCSLCHQVIDNIAHKAWATVPEDREWYMRRSMVRTWRKLIELGVIRFG